jgi:YegS/Rv2252/BmrU family lipid kinase
MRVVIIMNPIAGGAKAKKITPYAKEKLQSFGCDVEVWESTYAGVSVDLARQAAEAGFDRVVACGGDGTVLEVLTGLSSRPTVMGILPFGRGNDVSKDLGLPQNLEDSIQNLVDGVPKPMDAILARDRYFLGVGGVGLDGQAAFTAARCRRFLPQTSFAYTLIALWTLSFFRPFPLEFTLDGKTRVFPQTYLVAVGNTTTYSQGMQILPKALPNDGLLDACVITSRTRLHLFSLFAKVFSGSHIHDSGVYYFQGKDLYLNCPNSARKVYCFADGELLGTLPNRFSIAPRMVQILFPKEG